MMWMEQRKLEQGVEHFMDGSEKPAEHGLENDVDGPENPGTQGGE